MKKIIGGLLALVLSFVAIGGLVFLYARFMEPNLFRVREEKFPNSGTDVRVALFSDTHFGRDYPQEKLVTVIKAINDQNPDIVLFAGDFFDNYGRDRNLLDLTYMSAKLAEIKGKKFAVYGNHDYGGGAQFIFPEVMENGGFTVLRDETEILEDLGVSIVGFDDQFFRNTPVSSYTPETMGFSLYVAHEPDMAPEIASIAPGLIVSGHSHGGQVNIPFITEKIMPTGAQRFVRNTYSAEDISNNVPLFVTTGIGTTVLPVRLGNAPEVIILKITK